MNKHQLLQKLKEMNVPPNMYDLDGGLPNEALCLCLSGEIWQVYYSERGAKSALKVFQTQETACDYFYELIKSELDLPNV